MDKVRGFTLIELMVVVALVAIGAMIAVPSLRGMVRNNRAAAQTNELVSALKLARSEAVKRGGNVSVCARASTGTTCSGSDWVQGWLVFVDTDVPGTFSSANDRILEVFPPLPDSSTLTQTHGLISFNGNGFLDLDASNFNPSGNNGKKGQDADAELVFDLSVSGCTGNEKRQISINPQGRIAVSRQAC